MAARGQKSKTGASRQRKIDELNQSELNRSQSDESKDKLDEIYTEIQEMKEEMKTIVKQPGIEKLIRETVKEVMKSIEEKLNEQIKIQVKEKCSALQEEIKSLEFENGKLKEQLEKNSKMMEKKTAEIDSTLKDQEKVIKNSIKMGNQNEQYSRKNNVKIMNIDEERNENEEMLTKKVCQILNAQGIDLDKNDILAIHRLPTKTLPKKPVIIKTVNNNIKTRIMRNRKVMKQAGFRIADDVTKLNTDLMNRLNGHHKIESAWFFNGSVFGRTVDGKRLKFNLFDDVNDVIATYG